MDPTSASRERCGSTRAPATAARRQSAARRSILVFAMCSSRMNGPSARARPTTASAASLILMSVPRVAPKVTNASAIAARLLRAARRSTSALATLSSLMNGPSARACPTTASAASLTLMSVPHVAPKITIASAIAARLPRAARRSTLARAMCSSLMNGPSARACPTDASAASSRATSAPRAARPPTSSDRRSDHASTFGHPRAFVRSTR